MSGIVRALAESWWRLWGDLVRCQLWIYALVFSVAVLQYAGLFWAGQWVRVWSKLNLVSEAALLAHLSWSQIWYYVETKDMLVDIRNRRGDPSARLAVAVALAGVCVLRGLYYLAVILGFTGGL